MQKISLAYFPFPKICRAVRSLDKEIKRRCCIVLGSFALTCEQRHWLEASGNFKLSFNRRFPGIVPSTALENENLNFLFGNQFLMHAYTNTTTNVLKCRRSYQSIYLKVHIMYEINVWHNLGYMPPPGVDYTKLRSTSFFFLFC